MSTGIKGAREPFERVILATASNGFGNSQAALNLAAVFASADHGGSVRIINVYDYATDTQRRIVERGWEEASLTAGLRDVYRLTHRAVASSAVLSRLLHGSLRGWATRVEAELRDEGLDHFIALHPAAVPLGAVVKKVTGCRLSVIATDFVLHSIQCHELVDRYFVPPACAFVGGLARRARKQKLVVTSGIPLAEAFRVGPSVRSPQQEISDSFNVLVSFGASGYQGIRNLPMIADLIRRSDRGVKFWVVAGWDQEFLGAARAMVESLDDPKRVAVYGFVRDMAGLMARSHLVIGKAGGLSVSEAFCVGVPMVVIDTLPGHEEYNASVVERQEVGILTRSATTILSFIDEVRHPAGRSAIRLRSLRLGRPESTTVIAAALPPRRLSIDARTLRMSIEPTSDG